MAGYGEGIATGLREGLVWFANGLMWFEGMWFFIALAIGIPWIIWDEIRPRRMAAKRGKTRRDEKRLHDTSEADVPPHRTL
jgi:hypothetical protein